MNLYAVRLVALTFVIIAAILQLSFGSPSPTFRLLNAVALVGAAVVLTILVTARRRR